MKEELMLEVLREDNGRFKRSDWKDALECAVMFAVIAGIVAGLIWLRSSGFCMELDTLEAYHC